MNTNKKRLRSATQDSVVAYHEAGHAVASWHLHVKINGATIIPEGDSLGYVSHPPIPKRENPDFSSAQDRIRLQMERRAMVCLAGMEAQRRFRPSSVRSYHGSSDYKSVVDYLMGEAGDGEEVTLWVRLLVHRVRNLINLRWPAVEGVAVALLERKRLTREEVMDAIDVACGGTCD